VDGIALAAAGGGKMAGGGGAPAAQRTQEKFELHVEMPLVELPQPPSPDDIYFEGEIMGQYFRAPRPPGNRYKILLLDAAPQGRAGKGCGEYRLNRHDRQPNP